MDKKLSRSIGERFGFPAFVGPVLRKPVLRDLLAEHGIDYSRAGKCYVVYAKTFDPDQFEAIMQYAAAIQSGQKVLTPTVGGEQEPQRTVVDSLKALSEIGPAAPPRVVNMLADPRKADRFEKSAMFYEEDMRPWIVKAAALIREGAWPVIMGNVKPGWIAWAFGQERIGDMTQGEYAMSEFQDDPETMRANIIKALT